MFDQIGGEDNRDEQDELLGVQSLPSVLALPWAEYLVEDNPVLKLHRLCDVVEMVVRLTAIMAIAETRRTTLDNSLPAAVMPLFQQNSLERPTFGQWRNLLVGSVDALRHVDVLVPALLHFADNALLPRLFTKRGGVYEEAKQSAISLRNLLVHGGFMRKRTATELLEFWTPWLRELVAASRGLFSTSANGGETALFFVDKEAVLPLTGTEPTSPKGKPFHLASTPIGHVVLATNDSWLDLWPLVNYRLAESDNPTTFEGSPLVFLRSDRDRLLYSALLGEPSITARLDTLLSFQQLFALVPRELVTPEVDYEAELKEDSRALRFRQEELQLAKEHIKRTQQGILWISGAGGMGKSFLLARLAVHGLADPKKQCHIAWRFQVQNQIRGNRTAFFHHAYLGVARWLSARGVIQETAPAQADPQKLYEQLNMLVQLMGTLRPATGRSAPPRLLFYLDGLDEIVESDPDFANIPFRLSGPNVVWVCAGRLDGVLAEAFARDRCEHVFPHGLPPMKDSDIRTWLLSELGDTSKYHLLRADREGVASTRNLLFENFVRKAEGLPLYVQLVIDETIAGTFLPRDFDHDLPQGLLGYYASLLEKLSVGDLQPPIPVLVATLAWAKAPLDEAAIREILHTRTVCRMDADGDALFKKAIARLESVIATVKDGFSLRHGTFSEFIRMGNSSLPQQSKYAREEFERLAIRWKTLPAASSLYKYVLRFGVIHLLQGGRDSDAEALLTDFALLKAKVDAGLLASLLEDFPPAMPGTALYLVHRALLASANVLEQHPEQMASQLYGRLINCSEARIVTLLHSLRPFIGRLRPRSRSMLPLDEAAFSGYSGHTGWVYSVACSADSRFLLTGSADRTARIWDARTQHLLQTFRGHEAEVYAAVWDPSGTNIATSSGDRTVRLWDVATGRIERILRGHKSAIYVLAWSPDGNRLASASDDGTIRLWSSSGDLIQEIDAHSEGIEGLAWHPGSTLLLSGSYDRTLKIWDQEEGTELCAWTAHEGWVRGVAWSPDGEQIASCSDDLSVRIWKTPHARGVLILEPLHTFRGHTSAVGTVTWSPDSSRLVSASLDGTLRIWDPEQDTLVHIVQAHSAGAVTVIWSPNGQFLASSSYDCDVNLWDGTDYGPAGRIIGKPSGIFCVGWKPDGSRLLFTSEAGSLEVNEAVSDELVWAVQAHVGSTSVGVWRPDGSAIATAGNDHLIKVWDPANGGLRQTLSGHTEGLQCLAYSPEGARLASASWDKSLKFWDAETCDLLATKRLGAEAYALAWSRSGDVLLTMLSNNSTLVWDAQTLKRIARHRSPLAGLVAALAVHPTGSCFLQGGELYQIEMRHTSSGELMREFYGHSNFVSTLDWSEDGALIASGSNDHAIKLWDVSSAACLATFYADGAILSVAISPDSHSLVASDSFGFRHLFTIQAS